MWWSSDLTIYRLSDERRKCPCTHPLFNSHPLPGCHRVTLDPFTNHSLVTILVTTHTHLPGLSTLSHAAPPNLHAQYSPPPVAAAQVYNNIEPIPTTRLHPSVPHQPHAPGPSAAACTPCPLWLGETNRKSTGQALGMSRSVETEAFNPIQKRIRRGAPR